MGTGRIGALRATGHTAEALQQYKAAGRGAFSAAWWTLSSDRMCYSTLGESRRPARPWPRRQVHPGERVADPDGVAPHCRGEVGAARRPRRGEPRQRSWSRSTAMPPSGYSLVSELARTWRGLAALIEDDGGQRLVVAAPCGGQHAGRPSHLGAAHGGGLFGRGRVARRQPGCRRSRCRHRPRRRTPAGIQPRAAASLGRFPGGGGATHRRRSARRLGLARDRSRLGRPRRARCQPAFRPRSSWSSSGAPRSSSTAKRCARSWRNVMSCWVSGCPQRRAGQPR